MYFRVESLLAGVGGMGSSVGVDGGEVGETSLALFPDTSLFVVSLSPPGG